MAGTIDFYFDFYSPYAYLASHRIDELAAKHGCEVNWHPFLLGAIFAATGQKPLVQVPLLWEYSLHDLKRCARQLGVPFKLPEGFPKGAVAASRAYYWLQRQQPEQARPFARALFQATFGEGRDSSDPQLVAELARRMGLDAQAMMEGIQQQEIKDRLRQATDRARSRGVFGAPFFFVDGEPFWGNDRLEQLDLWLQRGGW